MLAQRYLHVVIGMVLAIRVVSNTVVEGHQQGVDVFKALELRLVDLVNHPVLVGGQVDWLVGELWRKVC